MRIRHLRYFLAVAEEQSFSRAATKVHIDASPLARAIKDLEAYLGVQLVYRKKGQVRLTSAGKVFREEARRILTAIENAKVRVRSATTGYRGQLRIGLADSLAQPRLTQLLALSREEEPTTEIKITEMTVSEMMLAIRNDELDAGITVDGDASDDLVKSPIWQERSMIAIPTRHPLLVLDKIPLREAIRYPLIMCHPESCSGGHKVIQQWFQDEQLSSPIIAEYVTGHEPMMMLVAAGYGIGIGLESQLSYFNHPDVVVRGMVNEVSPVTTYIVSPISPASISIESFIQRARHIGQTFASE